MKRRTIKKPAVAAAVARPEARHADAILGEADEALVEGDVPGV